jgi:hypothetical protein
MDILSELPHLSVGRLLFIKPERLLKNIFGKCNPAGEWGKIAQKKRL